MKKPKKKAKPKDTDNNFDYMKTNKDNIKNIIRDTQVLPIINNLVNTVNKIVIHTYQFLKLYCIYLYQNKRFRRLFKNESYETYLVNEFRTSKISNCCGTELEKFMYRPSKKPKRDKAVELCHGLLRCQSIKHKCEIIH